MLFDVTNYNQSILFAAFVIFTGGLFLLFKKKIYTLLDPMAMQVFWIGGNLAFLIAFIVKYSFSELTCLFIVFFLLYIFILRFALPNAKNNIINQSVYDKILQHKNKIKIIYVLITLLNFISKKPFFDYALGNLSLASWFLYRYVDLQGRDPLMRIIATGSETYFYLFSFILIFLLKSWKKRCLVILVIQVLIGVFSGGRSSALGCLINLGAFIFYFNGYFERAFIKKVNRVGLLLVSISLFIAIVVTSFYVKDATITDGFYTIVNRFIAVGDGLEYYMLYNGPHYIHSGMGDYFMATFGVYVKQFTSVEYKNVGTQLIELAEGEVSFAQGPNFDFPLQALVLGFYSWILYIPFISFIVAAFRRNRSKTLTFLPFSFFLCYNCFSIATDIEYGVLCLIAGTLIYFIFIYPILKLKF